MTQLHHHHVGRGIGPSSKWASALDCVHESLDVCRFQEITSAHALAFLRMSHIYAPTPTTAQAQGAAHTPAPAIAQATAPTPALATALAPTPTLDTAQAPAHTQATTHATAPAPADG
ncbi:hypothetical protein O181_050750 [Austropuccinia psidii MF-1]|uniref:Uncharacterized protein n=1 Tax=Austropuccinia psidii MF-1 TaxID=1389203 RepID=A0A9Q3DVW6_9BASI|nr:hypothetical protein [Austropuccinia psidii MF-1]